MLTSCSSDNDVQFLHLLLNKVLESNTLDFFKWCRKFLQVKTTVIKTKMLLWESLSFLNLKTFCRCRSHRFHIFDSEHPEENLQVWSFKISISLSALIRAVCGSAQVIGCGCHGNLVETKISSDTNVGLNLHRLYERKKKKLSVSFRSVLSHTDLVGYGCHGNAAADRSGCGCGSEEQNRVCSFWKKKKSWNGWNPSLAGSRPSSTLRLRNKISTEAQQSRGPRGITIPLSRLLAAGAEIYIFPDICIDRLLLCIQFLI